VQRAVRPAAAGPSGGVLLSCRLTPPVPLPPQLKVDLSRMTESDICLDELYQASCLAPLAPFLGH
jgi:hypothetical protein